MLQLVLTKARHKKGRAMVDYPTIHSPLHTATSIEHQCYHTKSCCRALHRRLRSNYYILVALRDVTVCVKICVAIKKKALRDVTDCLMISVAIKKKKGLCSRPGSNRGPCACEAHVITATLRKPAVRRGQFKRHKPSPCRSSLDNSFHRLDRTLQFFF